MRSILITGVGGGVGQSILKCLQGTGYRLVGVDGEALATGLYAVDRAYTIPYASQPGFLDRLLEIARAEGCDLLFPGLDGELPYLARSADRFASTGTRVVISDPEVVEISDDKLATARFLYRHGFASPVTRLLSEPTTAEMPFPVVLKPRKGGARSQGVFVARDPEAVKAYRDLLDCENYVVQEEIAGDEYTCSTVSLDGRCVGAIAMRRVLRDGDTYKAFVTKDPELTNYVTRVSEVLKPFGACNFQLRLRDGTPYIFEFNARCSGTTASRALAGFNEPLMIADFLLHGTQPHNDISEVTIFRYWKELAVDNTLVAQLAAAGNLTGSRTRL
jgi:carbamoyl-phosphate synthase large subunit